MVRLVRQVLLALRVLPASLGLLDPRVHRAFKVSLGLRVLLELPDLLAPRGLRAFRA